MAASNPPPAKGAPSDASEPGAAEAPAARPPVEAAVPRPVAPSPVDRSGRALKLAIAAIVVVLASVALLLVFPSIARGVAIARAREAGLDLTIEGAGAGLSGITFRGVGVQAMRTPGIRATIREIHLAGFFGAKTVRLLGVDARLEGERDALALALESLLAEGRSRLASEGSASPLHVSVVDARLSWDGTNAERLGASDIGVELEMRGGSVVDLRGSVGRFDVKLPGLTVGPWSSAFESAGSTSRVRVMFDPPVPDGPSAIALWRSGGPTEVTVKVPRSPFKNLGLRPAELGIPADDATDVQLSVTGVVSDTDRSELTFDATLWGLRPAPLPRRLDAHAAGVAKASPGKPFDLQKTLVRVGPFTAGLSGTVTPHARGARVDAVFKTLPVTCADLARAEAQNMGGLAATLQAFGQATGALRVTGAVNAAGVVQYDTEQPERASVTWTAKETCGVSIFGL